jgi:hypothetical protein
MKILYQNVKALILLIILVPIASYGQDCMWSSHAGGGNHDGGQYIFSDKSGNTYLTGVTKSSSCYFESKTISSSRFIVKYDINGNESWILNLHSGTGPNDGEIGGLSMAIDTTNDQLYLTGYFYDFLILPDTMISGAKNTILLMKLDLDGNILWYKTMGGVGDDQAFGITFDPDRNLYISGTNETDLVFGTDSVPRGGFIAKFDPDGNVIWAKNKFRFFDKWGSGQGFPFCEATPNNLLFSRNSLMVCGWAQNDTIIVDTVQFINGPVFNSAYLASFTRNGDFRWIKLAGGPDGISGGFTLDTSENIYITGMYAHKGIFDNDTVIAPGYYDDCFLAKYDSSGNLTWVTSTQSSYSAEGWSIACSPYGTVYMGGNFHGTAHFGNTTLTSYSSTDDMFLAKYSSDGNCIGVRQYHSGSVYGIGFDASNNVCFTGTYYDTLSIGPNVFLPWGWGDLFVAKCSAITGIFESPQNTSNELLIYANPTSGTCNITIPQDFQNEKQLTLLIYDLNGKQIQKVLVEKYEKKLTFDIKAQAKGVYQAVLTNGNKQYTGKIIFE